MRYPYYPGCTLKTHARNFEASALASARMLGIELAELGRWNCCGVVSSLTADNLMRHLAPLRNLSRVREAGEDKVVTLCSMCFHTLKRTNLLVNGNPEHLRKMNEFMDGGKPYDGSVRVLHFLEVLREMGFDAIAQRVTRPLAGLSIAPYYGCVILRPKEIGIDDPEEPSVLSELVAAMGASPVDTPFRKLCCGSYQAVADRRAAEELAHAIIDRARQGGADAIITTCPLCAFNLDSSQQRLRERRPGFREMPILYFTQLLALALGAQEEELGLDSHLVDPRPLLFSKGLLAPEAVQGAGDAHA